MDLNDLFNAFDRAAANVAKLEKVWKQAETFYPPSEAPNTRAQRVEYDDLRRAWTDLLTGLPPISGQRLDTQLADLDDFKQQVSALGWGKDHEQGAYQRLVDALGEPGRELAKYRYHLNSTRRRAAHDRLQQLAAVVDGALPRLLHNVPRTSEEPLTGSDVDATTASFSEIVLLMGGTGNLKGRWHDLLRHLRFGQGHDWHDIAEFDWPAVRGEVAAGALSDLDPLPVPEIDLGEAAAGELTGRPTLALPWERLDPEKFERLLHDLFSGFPEYENVAWLTNTQAADRGRDLSCDRVTEESTGNVRRERVIIQAKHWLTKPVDDKEVGGLLIQMKHWDTPPPVKVLIIATSGNFATSAVEWIDRHNANGERPEIQMWNHAKLEWLLAQRPHLAAAHGLR
ncbi:restriction endonuclease [Actinomadura viridis]|uniref:restriction endonuclease n=1 Tax=Actinomadura viridis TaxID=58110 RepID=UPI0036B212CA